MFHDKVDLRPHTWFYEQYCDLVFNLKMLALTQTDFFLDNTNTPSEIQLNGFWREFYKRVVTNDWMGGLLETTSQTRRRSFSRRAVECDSEESVPVEPIFNEIVSLAKIRGLDVDNNDIYELVEEHNQELPTEELMELYCVSQ
ncbi:hypothetical protein AVEN_164408-1 [Araneus ventricosus]|uniref:Uncharacterized protein n=1 Tax=Araneus ventricosus TaxID=182803 RepID=A0A4Y2GNN9_ARAVE|nr:hypothetical protein AVEN_164408-1 [Araneus ventricosus]